MVKADMASEGRTVAAMQNLPAFPVSSTDPSKATRWRTAAAEAGDSSAALLLGEVNEERHRDTEGALD